MKSTLITNADIMIVGAFQVGHENGLQSVDHLRNSFSVQIDILVGFLVTQPSITAASK